MPLPLQGLLGLALVLVLVLAPVPVPEPLPARPVPAAAADAAAQKAVAATGNHVVPAVPFVHFLLDYAQQQFDSGYGFVQGLYGFPLVQVQSLSDGSLVPQIHGLLLRLLLFVYPHPRVLDDVVSP